MKIKTKKILVSLLVLAIIFVAELFLKNSYFFKTNQDETIAIIKEEKSAEEKINFDKQELYLIERIVDGDTVITTVGGKKETIRLLGINTPETVDSRKPVECFGEEASNYTKSTLQGKNVFLESDPSQQDRDKYGRLLRYIFLEDGVLFNKKIIEEGFAYEYIYDLPYRYQTEFKQVQRQAQANKRGLWADGACSL